MAAGSGATGATGANRHENYFADLFPRGSVERETLNNTPVNKEWEELVRETFETGPYRGVKPADIAAKFNADLVRPLAEAACHAAKTATEEEPDKMDVLFAIFLWKLIYMMSPRCLVDENNVVHFEVTYPSDSEVPVQICKFAERLFITGGFNECVSRILQSLRDFDHRHEHDVVVETTYDMYMPAFNAFKKTAK